MSIGVTKIHSPSASVSHSICIWFWLTSMLRNVLSSRPVLTLSAALSDVACCSINGANEYRPSGPQKNTVPSGEKAHALLPPAIPTVLDTVNIWGNWNEPTSKTAGFPRNTLMVFAPPMMRRVPRSGIRAETMSPISPSTVLPPRFTAFPGPSVAS